MSIEFLTPIHPQVTQMTQAILDEFKALHGFPVQGTFATWDVIWRELVNAGIYRQGADVSEVGTSWLENIAAMKVLRPFSEDDVERLGGEQAFLPAAWSGVHTLGSQVWGIPVRTDTRMIWYWKDMFEAAGVDPQQAFASFEALPEAMEKLKKICQTPLAFGTSLSDGLPAQALASWLWQAGGDFVSPDGKQVLFIETEAMRSLCAFFDLHRYIPPANLPGMEVAEAFMQRKYCAVIGGPWFYSPYFQGKYPPEHFTQLGYTNLPGPAFVGGTVLVIWKHCVEPDKAFKLVRYLTSPRVQSTYPWLIGLMPARQENWNMSPLSTDPYFRIVYQALLSGRPFPNVPLWGMIEDRLNKTIVGTWYELFNTQNPDVKQIVHKSFTALARRLTTSIDQYIAQDT